MKKEKEFDFCKFPVTVWRDALTRLFPEDEPGEFKSITLSVRTEDASWKYDTLRSSQQITEKHRVRHIVTT